MAEPVGRRFMGPDSVTVQDEVGLGRHPPLWWTMNCHYNAAYDVQRMNVGSTQGNASLEEGRGDRRERFTFTKECPDLVAYMIAVRTELLMRVVMPAVVPHSAEAPYMAMARFVSLVGIVTALLGQTVRRAGKREGALAVLRLQTSR